MARVGDAPEEQTSHSEDDRSEGKRQHERLPPHACALVFNLPGGEFPALLIGPLGEDGFLSQYLIQVSPFE